MLIKVVFALSFFFNRVSSTIENKIGKRGRVIFVVFRRFFWWPQEERLSNLAKSETRAVSEAKFSEPDPRISRRKHPLTADEANFLVYFLDIQADLAGRNFLILDPTGQ